LRRTLDVSKNVDSTVLRSPPPGSDVSRYVAVSKLISI
jgi:hypothetical protein